MTSDSHAAAQRKFDSADAAAVYRRKFEGGRKDRLEKHCIGLGLAGVPSGGHVLDLPCGTGRLTAFLLDSGYRVTAADYSQHMIDQCRQRFGGSHGDRLVLLQADVMAIPFGDATFDAVLANRLFHHFTEPETRRKALRELGRVSRGPVVVSFFCSASLSAMKFRLVNKLRGVTPTDRIPIPFTAFRQDIEAAGLRVDAVYPVRRGISPQTYVRALRR